MAIYKSIIINSNESLNNVEQRLQDLNINTQPIKKMLARKFINEKYKKTKIYYRNINKRKTIFIEGI